MKLSERDESDYGLRWQPRKRSGDTAFGEAHSSHVHRPRVSASKAPSPLRFAGALQKGCLTGGESFLKILSLRHSEMKPPLNLEPSPDFVDPRRRAGFDRSCWPRCNGKAAPRPNSKDLHERRCLEFLAAFYQLNVLNQGLLAARKARAPKRRVKALLDKIASATTALEA